MKIFGNKEISNSSKIIDQTFTEEVKQDKLDTLIKPLQVEESKIEIRQSMTQNNLNVTDVILILFLSL